MTWHIVTMQKQIPKTPNYGHNYVALVNDDGKIVEEYHGYYSDRFTINDPVPGNFLIPIRRESGAVMAQERNVPLGTANTIPILRDGTYVNGIAQDLVSGDEASVRSAWNAGVNATNAALAGGKFLYVATDVRPFIGKDGINSNSVWGTFLRSIGIADPGSHNGPLIIPGVDVDLRTAPSNNPLFGQPDQDRLYNLQQHGALDPPSGDGTRFAADPLDPAAAADLAIPGATSGDRGSAATPSPVGAPGTDAAFANFDPDPEQAVGIMTPAELARAQAQLWRGGFAPGVHDAEIRALDELIYGPKPVAAEADGGAEPN